MFLVLLVEVVRPVVEVLRVVVVLVEVLLLVAMLQLVDVLMLVVVLVLLTRIGNNNQRNKVVHHARVKGERSQSRMMIWMTF